MHKYTKASGVILKKQNYRETDQIITIWTSELGKVRVLARGIRLAKSKLAGALQDLSLVEFEVTGRFPTIISAQVKNNFRGIRESLSKIAPAIYASEIILKMTADEQPNAQAFGLLVELLTRLHESDTELSAYTQVDLFALDLAEVLGFGRPREIESHRDVRNFIESLIERNLQSEQFLISI